MMALVWQCDHANHAEAMSDIADYIVVFYNSVRLHSKLDNLPPNAFAHQSAITQPIGVCAKTSPGQSLGPLARMAYKRPIDTVQATR